MQRYHHLTQCIFRPEEMNVLQAVFNEIIEQPWFDLNEFSREAFAGQVIQLYRDGTIDIDRLKELSVLTARAHFSRDNTKKRQKAAEGLMKAQPRRSSKED